MKLRILHHDHCFDGFASAAVFGRFYREKVSPGAEILFSGLSHKPNQKFIEPALFDGDENAIVDFKYSPIDRLTWWFDHHQSAFLSSEDEAHFRNGTWPTKFYNPEYKSCTQFIADTIIRHARRPQLRATRVRKSESVSASLGARPPARCLRHRLRRLSDPSFHCAEPAA